MDGTIVALTAAGTHEGGAALFHDGVDILEVDVDLGGDGDDFGDALGGGEKHIVGTVEGLIDVEVAKRAEFVVVDDDDGVDIVAQFSHAGEGLFAAFLAFESERQGDDGHDEDFLGVLALKVDALGYFGHDRSGSGAGAAAHTGGDEEHLGVVRDGLANVVGVVDGGLAGTLGLTTGAEIAQRNLVGDGRGIEGLDVGVANNEVDTLDALMEHVVDSVAATAADTNHLDVGGLFFRGIESEKRRICIFFHVLVYFYLTVYKLIMSTLMY